MKILVMGTGAVGGYFGAKLARAGEAVTFVARGAHLDAIRARGLRIRSSVEGESVVTAPATADPATTGPADLILVCVKAFDTESAARALGPAVGPETVIVSLQNGVDNEEKLGAIVGTEHVLGGVAYLFASIEAPGVIVHSLSGRIVFGELDGSETPRARRIRETFARAGIPVELSPHIQRALWEKYLMIVAHSGMTALTGCPLGVIRSVPETRKMYRLIVEELGALAKAAGIELPPEAVDTVMTASDQLAPTVYSSLHYDLTRGKRLELEALQGYAVRLGERLGVPTPMCFAVYASLKPFVDGPPV
ncbi:MAG: 2-dehydropantoate 2-reductase [Candidatus Rokubacteria bacterium]|nr:2-dehydropantoate 2-reductase [Candidatus Rokubacteria bacterium]